MAGEKILPSPAPAQQKATQREWIGLAVLALPCLLYSMDLTVLNLAVPHLTAELKPSASELLWIVDIYGFLLAGSLITMGTLGDRIGRRKLLMIGAAAFGSASVLAAFSQTATQLIIARGLLGIAGATLAPSTLSLIRNMFLDDRERTLAIGIWLASFSAGAVIGPFLGGLLLTYFWWGSVFLLNVPIMVLTLVAGPMLLPEYRDPNPGKLDILSAVLSVAAVLSVIWGVKQIAESSPHALAFLSIAAGLTIAVIFYRRQRVLDEPLIDVRLLQSPAIAAALSVNILTLFIAFGSFLFFAQYLQLVLGMTPLEAGLWTVPTGIVFVAGSVLTPFAARLIKPVYLIAGGLALAAIGYGIVALIATGGGLAALMTGMLIVCLGLCAIGTLTTDFVLGLAPPERAGAASAISETSFELGGALGIAVLGSVVTAIYRAQMTANGITEGPARDTLGGAVSAARDLSGPNASTILDVARQSFTAAFSVSAIVCAIIATLTCLLALRTLKRA